MAFDSPSSLRRTPGPRFRPVSGGRSWLPLCALLAMSSTLSACSVLSVADAAVTVVSTTVKVGAEVVGTTVDVAASGVRAVTGSNDHK